jgi:hypothetical protein
MNNLIKNVGVYYLLAFSPFFLILTGMKFHYLEGWLGISLFMFYAVLYRPYLDYSRLKAKGVVTGSFRYFDTLDYAFRYFKQLYWI